MSIERVVHAANLLGDDTLDECGVRVDRVEVNVVGIACVVDYFPGGESVV